MDLRRLTAVWVMLITLSVSAWAREKRPWGPEQAAGKPDTMEAGDSKTAWATLRAEMGAQWLFLKYEQAVEPAQIRIRETFNPGAVSKVEVYDEQNRAIVVWEGVDPTKECPGWLEVDASMVMSKVNRAKIHLDTNRVKGWNEIDAVELVAKSGAKQWAASAMASSTYASKQRRSGGPPRIVSTTPKIGASDVDPGLKEITVTFSQDMGRGFSWTGGGPLFPKTAGKPSWRTTRTCVLPVALEPGHFYRVGINSGKRYSSFRSAKRVPTETWAIWFTTQGAAQELLDRLKQPEIVSTVPEIGGKEVDPNLSEIKITFDQEMGGGFSLTGGGPTHPKGTGRPQWSEDKRTLIWSVKLEPNHQYRFGINSYSYKNFSSAYGVPVKSRLFQFRTRP